MQVASDSTFKAEWPKNWDDVSFPHSKLSKKEVSKLKAKLIPQGMSVQRWASQQIFAGLATYNEDKEFSSIIKAIRKPKPTESINTVAIETANGKRLLTVLVRPVADRRSFAETHWFVYFGGSGETIANTISPVAWMAEKTQTSWMIFNHHLDLESAADAILEGDACVQYLEKQGVTNITLYARSRGGPPATKVARLHPKYALCLERTMVRWFAFDKSRENDSNKAELLRALGFDLKITNKDLEAIQGKKWTVVAENDGVVAAKISTRQCCKRVKNLTLLTIPPMQMKVREKEIDPHNIPWFFQGMTAVWQQQKELLLNSFPASSKS